MRIAACTWLLLTAACAESAPAPAPAPSVEKSEVFGAAMDPSLPLTTLDDLHAEPEARLGSVVRTEGRIERVCQRKGCWLELGAEGVEPLRVPMAGHAFFIPQQALGHDAVVEGKLTSLPLPESHRQHVQSEGATALGPLALEATSVRVLP